MNDKNETWNPDLKFIEFMRSEIKRDSGGDTDSPAVGSSEGALSFNDMVDAMVKGSTMGRIMYKNLQDNPANLERYRTWLES
ncbi:MAG: hypothetical protein HY226_01030 [Candidatus Vogelbacteria bacterium]|nr:hypothetical protein [Candidatus Vogelbacteria bacterium]